MQTDLTHNPTITFLQCLGRKDRLLEDRAEQGAKDEEQSIAPKSKKSQGIMHSKGIRTAQSDTRLTSKPVKIRYQIDGLIHLSICHTCSSSHQLQ
jgi:hypothetical protein